MKSAAEVAASAASKVMTTAPSSPVAASRRSLSRSLESWNSVSCGRRNSRGCGAKVKAAALRPSLAGAREGGADHGAVAAMHAVEIADRHHGAVQRPDIDRARRATWKAFAGWPGLFMGRPGYGRRYRPRTCSFSNSAGRLGVATVTAPLTKFQINGLFKRRC